MSTPTKPKSDILRATKAYLRENLQAAEIALADPAKYPYLQEWARMIKEKAAK